MRSLPKSITVAGKRYVVQRRNSVAVRGEDCWGACDTDRCVIEIKTRGVSLDHQLETLLHEALHAIEEEMRFELPEDVIDKLSKALYALLKDNL